MKRKARIKTNWMLPLVVMLDICFACAAYAEEFRQYETGQIRAILKNGENRNMINPEGAETLPLFMM